MILHSPLVNGQHTHSTKGLGSLKESAHTAEQELRDRMLDEFSALRAKIIAEQKFPVAGTVLTVATASDLWFGCGQDRARQVLKSLHHKEVAETSKMEHVQGRPVCYKILRDTTAADFETISEEDRSQLCLKARMVRSAKIAETRPVEQPKVKPKCQVCGWAAPKLTCHKGVWICSGTCIERLVAGAPVKPVE